MYSETVQKHIVKEHRRGVLRRCRQGALLLVLLVVAIWGWLTYRADHHTFAWDRKVSIGVVALLDDDGETAQKAEWFIQRFLSQSGGGKNTLGEVQSWLQKEYARHTGDAQSIVEFFVRGPVRLATPPPDLPEAEDSFFTRWNGVRTFINYFKEISRRDELQLAQCDATLFVYFYDYHDQKRRHMFAHLDSLASRSDRMGICFVPTTKKHAGYSTAVVAHELCHTFGASDKYDGGVSLYPAGYAEPDRQPRYPQRHGEIMSLGRPVSAGVDRPVRGLRECIVGDTTAEEMNWAR